jgi:hypothetical protein
MRRAIFLLIIACLFGVSAFAQKAKPGVAALPADIAMWNGEHSDKILNDPVIKSRLKKLLGNRNYGSFIDSFETITPIIKDGDTLFASGCLIHACTHLESAVAIHLKANTIHAAIYNEEKKTRYVNERGSKTPASITDWATRLSGLKTNK